jgi:hypothetical protein
VYLESVQYLQDTKYIIAAEISFKGNMAMAFRFHIQQFPQLAMFQTIL